MLVAVYVKSISHSSHLQTGHKKEKPGLKVFLLKAFIILFIAMAMSFIPKIFGFSSYRMQGNSMLPNIILNDWLIISNNINSINKNDIIHLKNPSGIHDIICRVIASEGEVLKITHATIWVNNQKLKSLSIPLDIPKDLSPRDNIQATKVRPDHYFCLNDNWNNYLDSRSFGVIHKKNILGKVIFKNFFQSIKPSI